MSGQIVFASLDPIPVTEVQVKGPPGQNLFVAA